MDLEKLTHRGYQTSVIIAVVLSAMLITFASLLGRSALNLRGSLLMDIPTDVTVIALVEPELGEEVKITNVHLLRKEEDSVPNQKPMYAYQVSTSAPDHYFALLKFDTQNGVWTLSRFEHLHE